MSIRAVVLGLLLGLGIAAFSYYNDWIVNQRFFLGHLLPISILGAIVVLLLVVNPLLRSVGPKWPLRAPELAVIAALALAPAGWPGGSFFYTFGTNLVMPAQLIKTQANWQAVHAMSYVPGGSAQLADGHVRDWAALAEQIKAAEDATTGPEAAVWEAMSFQARRALDVQRPDASQRKYVLRSINSLIEDPTFYQRYDPSLLTDKGNQRLERRKTFEQRRIEAQALRDQLYEEAQQIEAQLAPRLSEIKEEQTQLRDRKAEIEQAMLEEPGGSHEQWRAELDQIQQQLEQLGQRERAVSAPLREKQNQILVAERTAGSYSDQINRVDQSINRALLVGRFDSLLRMPEGEGVLVSGGQADRFATDVFLQGWDGPEDLELSQMPWHVWWPTLKLWGGFGLITALAGFCLVIIVHPQWSRRELLPYPLAKFVSEAIQPSKKGYVPEVAMHKLFWLGFAAMAAFHIVNGLNMWFPDIFFVQIPQYFPEFTALNNLNPDMRQISGNWAVFQPIFWFSVVAFAFFLSTDVSLSMGISGIAWIAFGVLLLNQGITIENSYIGAKNNNMLLFGAYMGMALMIGYIGRRYYLNVIGSALGMRRQSDTPAYVPWAARALALAVVLMLALLINAGLDWVLAIILVALILMVMLIITRINAEAGAIFIQPYWMPVGVMTGFLGMDAIGPEAYILMAITCVIVLGDTRELIMAFLANSLRIADSANEPTEQADEKSQRLAQRTTMGRVVPLVGFTLVAGFVVSLLATFYFQYNDGALRMDNWSRQVLPSLPMETMVQHVGELSGRGELTASIQRAGLERLGAAAIQPGLIGWFVLGLSLVLACSIARLRLPWWPIHPVLFLMWGTFGGYRMAWCFLAGWLIKTCVVRLGGAKGYHEAKPLMVGVIAGEVVLGVIWLTVGVVYYMVQNVAPPGTVVKFF